MESSTEEQLLTTYLARISRLEMATLALVKSLAESGNLPNQFAPTFTADVTEYAKNLPQEAHQLRTAVEREGARWIPVFTALGNHSQSKK